MDNIEKPICPLCNMDSDNCICHRWYLINSMNSFMERIKELEDDIIKLHAKQFKDLAEISLKYENKIKELEAENKRIKEHIQKCPFGWINGKIIYPKSYIENDLLEWLQDLKALEGE